MSLKYLRRPVMPKCMSSQPPSSSSTKRFLPWRRVDWNLLPFRVLCSLLAETMPRILLLRTLTDSIFWCSEVEFTYRLKTSTSGSSGIRISPYLPQGYFHAVVCDFDSDSAFAGHLLDPGDQGRLVASDEFRAAVGEDRARHPLFLTPGELGADRRVAEEGVAPPAHHGTYDGGSVAHVQLSSLQRLLPVVDVDDVRRVEDGRPPPGDFVPHRGSANGVLDREGLDDHTPNLDGPPVLNHVPISDVVILNKSPGFFRGVDRAWPAPLEPPCVVRMGVGDEDGLGSQIVDLAEPVGAAIDHDLTASVGHHEGAVHAVAGRPRLDLAAGAQESELHDCTSAPRSRRKLANSPSSMTGTSRSLASSSLDPASCPATT